MNIQWFPGHMTKALRMMQDSAKIVDAFGYVLDARAPMSCFNPSFENIIGQKPCVFILNKCDLADPEKVNKWCEYFKNQGYSFVKITATASAEASKITSALFDATTEVRNKFKAKGIFKPARCLILGVPNSGKSTIINCLAGKKTVITGDKPGVTKGKQWVRLANGLELLDTPGTLWPKFDDEQVGARLCFIGSIKDDVVDIYEACLLLIDELLCLYPNELASRYKIEIENKRNVEIFNDIAQKRGFLLRGGSIDEERCAKAILDDFRKGKIGKITFELPKES